MCPLCFVGLHHLTAAELDWVGDPARISYLKAVYFEDGAAAVEESSLTSQPRAMCFCFSAAA